MAQWPQHEAHLGPGQCQQRDAQCRRHQGHPAAEGARLLDQVAAIGGDAEIDGAPGARQPHMTRRHAQWFAAGSCDVVPMQQTGVARDGDIVKLRVPQRARAQQAFAIADLPVLPGQRAGVTVVAGFARQRQRAVAIDLGHADQQRQFGVDAAVEAACIRVIMDASHQAHGDRHHERSAEHACGEQARTQRTQPFQGAASMRKPRPRSVRIRSMPSLRRMRPITTSMALESGSMPCS